MNIPGFYADASIQKSSETHRGASEKHERSGGVVPSILSARLHHIPFGSGINWSCYEMCVAQNCFQFQNLQTCQRNCLNQCTESFPVPSVWA